MAKNVLTAGGLRPLRYQARFAGASAPPWRGRFFLPALLAPPGVWLMMALAGLIRSRLNRDEEATAKRKRARAARRRLAEAEKLKGRGSPQAFYAEVENALLHFLGAKLGTPVGGLTRPALEALMQSAQVPELIRGQVLRVLEVCDVGRFSPAGGEANMEQVLDEAQAAMEDWESK